MLFLRLVLDLPFSILVGFEELNLFLEGRVLDLVFELDFSLGLLNGLLNEELSFGLVDCEIGLDLLFTVCISLFLVRVLDLIEFVIIDFPWIVSLAINLLLLVLGTLQGEPKSSSPFDIFSSGLIFSFWILPFLSKVLM